MLQAGRHCRRVGHCTETAAILGCTMRHARITECITRALQLLIEMGCQCRLR